MTTVDPDYEAFLKWKGEQAATVAPPTPEETGVSPIGPDAEPGEVSGIGPDKTKDDEIAELKAQLAAEDTPTVEEPPAEEVVDPKDAEIADLKAQLAAKQAARPEVGTDPYVKEDANATD